MHTNSAMTNSKRVFASLVLGFATIWLSTACTHVVKRPVACEPPPAPLGRSALAWQRAATRGVHGSVVAPGILAPINAAIITLTPVAAERQPTITSVQTLSGADGAFRIDSISPARYLLLVRRLGYRPVRDTVHADSGIVATAVLAPEIIRFDECGAMYQEVRVPWWKHSTPL